MHLHETNIVRNCCANPEAFVNMIFKKGSSSPSKRTMIMLKMIAIENILRMSLMYLNKNANELRSIMRICAKNGEESSKFHEDHMENILAGFIPPTEDHEKEFYSEDQIEEMKFASLEKWVGHDILVNAIVAAGKGSGKNAHQVFETDVQPDEWKTFKRSEKQQNEPTPNRNAEYPPAEKEIGKKEKKLQGKSFCKNRIPGKRN
jgi:hypothetical protein